MRYLCARDTLMMRVRKQLTGDDTRHLLLLSIERPSLLIRAINRGGSLREQLGAISRCDSASLRRTAPRYYIRRWPNATMENLPMCLWSSRSRALADDATTGTSVVGAVVTIHHLNVTRLRVLHPSPFAKSRPYSA